MSYLSKRLAAPVAAVALLMLSGAQVLATSLPALASVVGPPSAGLLPAGAPTTTNSGNYTLKDALNNTVGTGTYNISLYAPDPGTGKVTLTYNFTVLTGIIEHVSLINFAGAPNVDVTQNGGGFTTTGFSRPIADGSLISFDFNKVASGTSTTFIIRTDAQYTTAGSLSFIDGGTANVVSFSPTSAPTPAAAWGGLSLLGLLGLSRKRRMA